MAHEPTSPSPAASSAEITVERLAPAGADPDRGAKPGPLALRFVVRVREGMSQTTHEVTASPESLARLARTDEPPEAFVRRCFVFLLERETKESILGRFDLSVISRYFPEFERAIRNA